MVKIAPSILSADFANLEREIGRISDADYVHVDVMDGVFVPNITIGIPVVRCIRPVTKLPLDVHLMIVRPVRYVEAFCDAGADIVTVHVESDTPDEIRAALDKIHARGGRAGIVLSPGTPAQAAEPFLEHVDMILGGGGQDTGQKKIIDDLFARADDLRRFAADGVPMLMICGLYQLFGHYFETIDGTRLDGIGIIGAHTIGRDVRMIGNLVEHSAHFGDIIGYENHSGQTFLDPGVEPLGRVDHDGTGNNGEDHTEGARVNNVIGTYMHGSLLPKNPAIADFLIRAAAERRYGAFEPRQAKDRAAELARIDGIAAKARTVAAGRPR